MVKAFSIVPRPLIPYRIKATIIVEPNSTSPDRFKRVLLDLRASSTQGALEQAYAQLPGEIVALSAINVSRCSVHDLEAQRALLPTAFVEYSVGEDVPGD